MNRLDSMKRLSIRVKRISNQIQSVLSKSRLENMKDILRNVLDSEKEIAILISEKNSSQDHSRILRNIYDESSVLLIFGKNSIDSLKEAIETKDINLLEIKNEFSKIKESILKSLKKLDSYYKLNINPTFNTSGITSKDINFKMNELKLLNKEIRKF